MLHYVVARITSQERKQAAEEKAEIARMLKSNAKPTRTLTDRAILCAADAMISAGESLQRRYRLPPKLETKASRASR